MKKRAPFMYMPFMIMVAIFLAGCEKKGPEPESTTVTDYDGNVYTTVRIFTKVWMSENLRTSRLNDGTNIELVPDNWNWDFLDVPKRCFYNNDGPAYRDSYGYLYNSYAVNTKKLCPVGWHVPTREEWGTLIGYLGGYGVAGGKLKESETTHWYSPNAGADNSSGFTALPGGFRTGVGLYNQMGNLALFWSAGTTRIFEAVQLTYNSSSASVLFFTESYGVSVRCVKDE